MKCMLKELPEEISLAVQKVGGLGKCISAAKVALGNGLVLQNMSCLKCKFP